MHYTTYRNKQENVLKSKRKCLSLTFAQKKDQSIVSF